MKKDDARTLIIQEWVIWFKSNASDSYSTNMLLFYDWLKSNRPWLLLFRSAGDQWQTVKGWIQDR